MTTLASLFKTYRRLAVATLIACTLVLVVGWSLLQLRHLESFAALSNGWRFALTMAAFLGAMSVGKLLISTELGKLPQSDTDPPRHDET